MTITKQNAIKGTVVILTSSKYGDGKYNPVYNSTEGQVTGVVEGVDDHGWIEVSWSNGQTNSYENGTLESAPVAVAVSASVPTVTITPAGIVATPVVKPSIRVVTLVDIVKEVCDRFVNNSTQAFSAYDVTTRIRSYVNNKEVSIYGKAIEDVSGTQTQRIEHAEVRDLVRDYLATVQGIKREFNTTLGFTTFRKVDVPVPTPTPIVPAGSPVLTFAPTGATLTGTSTFITKLQTYIANKGSATLKQIQSRFKVEGGDQITVREIYKTVNLAGLKISAKVPYHASVVSR